MPFWWWCGSLGGDNLVGRCAGVTIVWECGWSQLVRMLWTDGTMFPRPCRTETNRRPGLDRNVVLFCFGLVCDWDEWRHISILPFFVCLYMHRHHVGSVTQENYYFITAPCKKLNKNVSFPVCVGVREKRYEYILPPTPPLESTTTTTTTSTTHDLFFLGDYIYGIYIYPSEYLSFETF